jgi:hypothetical protein
MLYAMLCYVAREPCTSTKEPGHFTLTVPRSLLSDGASITVRSRRNKLGCSRGEIPCEMREMSEMREISRNSRNFRPAGPRAGAKSKEKKRCPEALRCHRAAKWCMTCSGEATTVFSSDQTLIFPSQPPVERAILPTCSHTLARFWHGFGGELAVGASPQKSL